MRVRFPISLLSQARPQKSDSAPRTVAARMELVPRPDPAGIAARRVTSMPHPKDLSWSSRDLKRSAENSGMNPASASAALGMENGEPTFL